jgi:hypothetical protein
MITTEIIDGILSLVEKRTRVKNIEGGKKEVSYITRILDIHTGIPKDIRITTKII